MQNKLQPAALLSASTWLKTMLAQPYGRLRLRTYIFPRIRDSRNYVSRNETVGQGFGNTQTVQLSAADSTTYDIPGTYFERCKEEPEVNNKQLQWRVPGYSLVPGGLFTALNTMLRWSLGFESRFLIVEGTPIHTRIIPPSAFNSTRVSRQQHFKYFQCSLLMFIPQLHVSFFFMCYQLFCSCGVCVRLILELIALFKIPEYYRIVFAWFGLARRRLA